MRRITNSKRFWMLAFVYSAVLGAALSWAIGGNLGSYGANYSPPVFTGKVTDDAGAPQASVRVGTLAGHFTSTDVNGDYTLAVGVAGIYSVYADVSPQRLTAMVDTNLGQTVILDFPVKTSAVFWTLYR